MLTLLTKNISGDLDKTLRQKFEMIITDFVHSRDVTRDLIKNKIESVKEFAWQYYMRFIWNPKESDILQKLLI